MYLGGQGGTVDTADPRKPPEQVGTSITTFVDDTGDTEDLPQDADPAEVRERTRRIDDDFDEVLAEDGMG